MKPRTTISIEALEQLREEIAQAPPVTRERFTKLEAVRRLRPDLQAMRERGYSLQAIAKFLSDRGVSLAPTVLSSYLSEAKSGHESRPKRSKGPMRGPVRTSSGSTVDT
ncbi:MAG: hypothetical protein ABSE49_31765, partial [Polyangiaceae bacterium]